MKVFDKAFNYCLEFKYSVIEFIGRALLKRFITETFNEDGSVTYVFSTLKYSMSFNVVLKTTLQSLKDMGIETVNNIKLDYVPLPYLHDRVFLLLLEVISENIEKINDYPTMFLTKQTPNELSKYIPTVANTHYHRI